MRTFDTTDLNTIIGTGIQFPVQLSTEPSKLLKTEEGLDVIKQSIFIILSTRLGSRYNNPLFGSNIYRCVFEQNDAILKDLVYLYTVSALTKWEKRISITRVQFIKNTTDDHFLGIKIHFIVRNTHQAGSYVFPFSATGQPMSTLLV